ncbi:hypothetical protein CRV04_04775 [Candidatus Marinarcus aquaticus]|uniref:Uncharacterized protein n=1 Tax=Candidatus Marinarcus aquaticus TaxID=2044504 RepID=A0A4Q0XSK4_9BACT|nr:hypothetical protein CRV04_04775 [Candidatus Marinarcus aquaticus]
MKKLIALTALLLSITLYAHTLLMNVMDNEDGTIVVMGQFSTGENAQGALVRLESLITGEILFKQRLPQESEITIEIPKEPYQIVLDGGPGHTIIKEGIEPVGGFSVKADKKDVSAKLSQAESVTNEWSMPMIVFGTLTMILIGFTLYFSMKNTQKILQMVKENN